MPILDWNSETVTSDIPQDFSTLNNILAFNTREFYIIIVKHISVVYQYKLRYVTCEPTMTPIVLYGYLASNGQGLYGLQ